MVHAQCSLKLSLPQTPMIIAIYQYIFVHQKKTTTEKKQTKKQQQNTQIKHENFSKITQLFEDNHKTDINVCSCARYR